MSRDRSLKSSSALVRHRNVLTRHERIEKLKDDDQWKDDSGPFGLPKVAHRKVSVGKKSKIAEQTETTETAETPTAGETKSA